MRHVTGPVVGSTIRIRAKALPLVNRMYGLTLDEDSLLTVEILSHPKAYGGRGCVYARPRPTHDQAEQRLLMLWRSQVTAIPRCPNCDAEAHSLAQCKATEP